MGKEFNFIHRANKRGEPVNVELSQKGKHITEYYGGIKIEYNVYCNLKYVYHRIRQYKEIKEALEKGCQVKQFKNWVEINGKVYNGWNLQAIYDYQKIIEDEKEEINLDDFEFEGIYD